VGAAPATGARGTLKALNWGASRLLFDLVVSLEVVEKVGLLEDEEDGGDITDTQDL